MSRAELGQLAWILYYTIVLQFIRSDPQRQILTFVLQLTHRKKHSPEIILFSDECKRWGTRLKMLDKISLQGERKYDG